MWVILPLLLLFLLKWLVVNWYQEVFVPTRKTGKVTLLKHQEKQAVNNFIESLQSL